MSYYLFTKIIDRKPLALGTTRHPVEINALQDLSWRWTVEVPAAAPNAATITFYPSELRCEDLLFDEFTFDPAVNPYLVADATAAFPTLPGNVATSDWLTLGSNPWQTMIVEINCTIAIPRFSFSVGGRTGGR